MILTSGTAPGAKRKLQIMIDGEPYPICWSHWKCAFKWDHDDNPMTFHRTLSKAHMNPNPQDKMRNKLAEDCLDANMLHLMQVSNLDVLRHKSLFLGRAKIRLQISVFIYRNTRDPLQMETI